jgi:hypothetical protein
MADGDVRIGLNGSFLYGTAGSQAAVTDAQKVVVDVTFSGQTTKVDITSRGGTWEVEKPVLLSGQLSVKCMSKEGDALVPALLTAWKNKTTVAVWARESATGEGIDADFYVELTRNEPLKGRIEYDFSLTPTNESREPVWQ